VHPNGTCPMPLVRIITRLSEYPTELVRDLRTRGFDVETCLPPSQEQQAADLEITLDQCSPENLSDALAHALKTRDVVMVSNGHGNGGRVRSIGMVMVSSDEDFQTSRKTAVPLQFNEIYTALLRERAQNRLTAISANWESMRQKTQQLNGTWKYFRTVGRNLGDLGSRTMSEAGIWMKAKRSSWTDRRRLRVQAESDLVPSMFSLSGEVNEIAEPPLIPRVESASPTNDKKTFSIWKPVTAGAAAILAVTLWVHGSSHSELKADQAGNESSVHAAVAPAIQAVQKAEKPDPSASSKVLAKSNSDDNFQEVVVRHFDHSAPRTIEKDGVKRRVVVD